MERNHYVIEFVEKHFTASQGEVGTRQLEHSETFLISTRKLLSLDGTDDFEHSYVKHLVALAVSMQIRGISPRIVSRRELSLSAPINSWYVSLAPDDSCAADQKFTADVEIE